MLQELLDLPPSTIKAQHDTQERGRGSSWPDYLCPCMKTLDALILVIALLILLIHLSTQINNHVDYVDYSNKWNK